MAVCTKNQIEDILSAEGVMQATDDLGVATSANATMISNAIERAEVRIKQYTAKLYPSTEITYSNAWVKWAGAYLAAGELMRRRGSGVPVGIQTAIDEIIAHLETVRDGVGEIPDAAPIKEPGLTMTNVRTDLRYPVQQQREVIPSSTGEIASDKKRRNDPRGDNFFPF